MVELEDKTDFPAARSGSGFIVHVARRLALQKKLTRSGLVEQPQHVQEGTFAGARRSDQGGKIILIDLQVDTVQNLGLIGFSHVIRFAQLFQR